MSESIDQLAPLQPLVSHSTGQSGSSLHTAPVRGSRRMELVAEYYMMHHKRRRYDFVVNESAKVEFFQSELTQRLGAAPETPPNSRTALDLGCRGGTLTNQVKPWASWLGVDVDPAALEQARTSGLTCRQMDIAVNLDFADQSFDIVMMTEVLEHLPYPIITLSEIHRILKQRSASLFMGSVPIDYHLRRRLALLMGRRLEGDPTHIHSFSVLELRQLLEHYFHEVKFHFVRTPHWPWSLLPPSLSVIDAFWVASNPKPGVSMAEIRLRH